MKREINLACGIPKKATLKFPPELILRILAAYAGILIVIWCLVFGMGLHQQVVLTKVKSEQSLAAGKLAQEQAKYAITQKLAERAKFWAELLKQKGQHYSNYFHDLALQVPQGVWLDTIQISKSGTAIKLSGKTFNPPLAMVLLQNLNATPAFKDKKFKMFSLTVAPSSKDVQHKLASFIVSTE